MDYLLTAVQDLNSISLLVIVIEQSSSLLNDSVVYCLPSTDGYLSYVCTNKMQSRSISSFTKLVLTFSDATCYKLSDKEVEK